MKKFLCRLNLINGRLQLPTYGQGSIQNYVSGDFTPGKLIQDTNTTVLLLGEARIRDKSLSIKESLDIYNNNESDLSKIEGHFLLLIIDIKNQVTKLFTDKFTTHPAYYYADQKQILFSSTLKGLVSCLDNKPDISSQALFSYLYFHCIPSPSTIYQGVKKLEPAHLLTWKEHKLTSSLYWKPTFTNSNKHSESEQCEILRNKLNSSIKNCRIDDNVGAFLSGGLDSSSVTAYLAKNSKGKAKTFTIGFSEPGYDETEFAQAVAEHFGTEHHVYQLKPIDVLEALPKIAAHYDEPFGNSSALPTYFCAKFAKQKGVDTLLAGDGGDELFAGNERYANQKVFAKYTQLPALIRTPLDFLIPTAAKICPINILKKANSYIYQANQGLPERLQHYNFLHQNPPETVFTADILKKVDNKLPTAQLKTRYNEVDISSPTDNMLYLDWKFTLADNDLVKVNNMTDLAGITVKYPMLSPELLNFSCQVSAERKLPGCALRHFYKKALTPVLPGSTINKSKQGFGLPFGKWLAKDKELMVLTDNALNSLKTRNIIKSEFIDRTLDQHRNVHASFYGELVWLMVMLELWLNSH